MMKRSSWAVATLLAAGIVSISGVAAASSHREAPAIGDDPAADNTDLYAWVQGENLIILANYVPLEEPAGGPNFHKFSDDVLYEIHIVRGGADLNDALKYQIQFKTDPYAYVDPADMQATVGGGKEFFSQIAGGAQKFTLTKIEGGVKKNIAIDVPVAPPNIGPRTNSIAYKIVAPGTYDTYVSGAPFLKDMGPEGKVWAGPRDDGFYVDLGAVFDLAGICPATGCTAHDNVAGYNTHTIAIEVPINIALNKTVVKGTPDTNQTLGIWASASRRKTRIYRSNGTSEWLGPWTQVSRLGIPLINEAVIGLQDKDLWNRVKPSDDVAYFGAYFLNPVVVRDAEFAGFYGAGGALAACGGAKLNGLKTNRLDILDVINLKNIPIPDAHNITATGDVLRVDLGIPSGFPNGRPLVPDTNAEQADVTDVELGLLLTGLDPTCLPGFGGTVPDGVGANDKKFLAQFPYLAGPWEGFSDGHNAKGTR
jgi:Domain of unknown function (DUF4331)